MIEKNISTTIYSIDVRYMSEKPRILTSEGEIIRILMNKSLSTAEIVSRAKTSRAAVYNNLKDLLIAGFVIRNGDAYRVSGAGLRAYFTEVLPDVDADFIIGLGSRAGLSPLRVVGLGVRVLQALDGASYLPADLVRLLARYDPSLLEDLQELFGGRPGGAGLNQAAEVVE